MKKGMYDKKFDDQKRLIEYMYVDAEGEISIEKIKYFENGFVQGNSYGDNVASVSIQDDNNDERSIFFILFQRNGSILSQTISIYDNEKYYEELHLIYNLYSNFREESCWKFFSNKNGIKLKDITFDTKGKIIQEFPTNPIDGINCDEKYYYLKLEKRFLDKIPPYDFDEDWFIINNEFSSKYTEKIRHNVCPNCGDYLYDFVDHWKCDGCSTLYEK